jgi:hypothetical protein
MDLMSTHSNLSHKGRNLIGFGVVGSIAQDSPFLILFGR